MGDAQIDVIDDGGERIEIAAVLADQHRIGHGRRVDGLRSLDQIVELDRRSIEAEAPVRCAPLRLKRLLLLWGQRQRGAIIERGLAEQARAPALDLELFLGLVGGVEPTRIDQPLLRRFIERSSIGLPDLEGRRDPEPCQICFDAVGEFLRRARNIGIVEAQHVAATGLEREQPVEQRRPGIAQMQPSGRRRRVADNGHSTPCLAGSGRSTGTSLSSR